ncbi:type I-E CRISPR-associated protein Cas6/Cse3/CasE [Kitasatospora purpeofusca]|uniref:type I-E CRISPR-associated protein Cas6/Cse3/CasE n=1 Tax=Kitasatospora purpeofusca TaxID=67352 RepID=UPI0035D85D76
MARSRPRRALPHRRQPDPQTRPHHPRALKPQRRRPTARRSRGRLVDPPGRDRRPAYHHAPLDPARCRPRNTDVEALRTRLTGGIGKGKAYGSGLLSLAPHRGER